MSISDDEVEAAAEVMWNDLFGARAGAWDSPPADSVSGIQFRATARAALRAAAKVRAIREGDGEAEPVDPNSWEGAFARLTGADNLEAGAGDLVERLQVLLSKRNLLFAECSVAEEWEAALSEAVTKLGHAQYAMDAMERFVRPRIPADQNPEQATSFLAWIGMILRLEERAEQAAAQLAAVTAENARLRERIEQAYKAGFDFAMLTEAPK